MQSQASTYRNDFLISGAIAFFLSPILIIVISVVDGYWPDGYHAGIGPRFFFVWFIFAIIGTIIFFIISLFTDKGLYVTLRGHTGEKNVEMILPSSLPPSATPSDTISEEKTQESHSEKKDIKSEKNSNVEESSMEKLEKLIERRNVGEITSEEFDQIKKEIMEEKPQVSKKSAEIELEESQTDKNVIKIQDSTISESNAVHSDDDTFTKLKDLTEMKEKGFIDDDEFKQMKKEILG